MYSQGVHFTLGFGDMQTTSSKRPKEDCGSSRSQIEDLEREQGVNQGEGRKDLRHAQPESAGCSACQAQGWAGLVMTRLGTANTAVPAQCGLSPTHGQANQRRGSHTAKQRGSGHLSRALFPPSCPGLGPWTEPCLLCLQPQRGVFRALCLFRPTYPHPPLMPCLPRLWLAQKGSQEHWPHPRDPAALPSGLTSASRSSTSLASHHLARMPT